MAGTSLSWDLEKSHEFTTSGLLDEDSDDSTSAGGSQTINIPKMPLNPVNRHVSAHFLKKNSSELPKFETLEEANQKQIRSRIKSIKRQDSEGALNKGKGSRRLSRTESMLMKRLKKRNNKTMITEESEDECESQSSTMRPSQNSSRTNLSNNNLFSLRRPHSSGGSHRTLSDADQVNV